ncbi:MAG TPA: dihydroneopterin aldolase [Bacteroidia bacterium]|jgi:dihydroneopterin aldolase
MGKILVEGIKLYAYHGCMEEEGRIGRSFVVDVTIETDLGPSTLNDSLADTIDYVKVYDVVKEEMAVRSKLIEHVGGRIIDHLKRRFPKIIHVEVKVTKLNPPIDGNVDSVSVVIGS